MENANLNQINKKYFTTLEAQEYLKNEFDKINEDYNLMGKCSYELVSQGVQNGILGFFKYDHDLNNLNSVVLDCGSFYNTPSAFRYSLSHQTPIVEPAHLRNDISQVEIAEKMYVLNHELVHATDKVYPDTVPENQSERVQLEFLICNAGNSFYQEHYRDTLIEARANQLGVLRTINQFQREGMDFSYAKELGVQAYNFNISPNSPFANHMENPEYNPKNGFDFSKLKSIIPSYNKYKFSSFKEWEQLCNSRMDEIMNKDFNEPAGYVPGLFRTDISPDISRPAFANTLIIGLGFDSDYYNSLDQREKLYLQATLSLEFVAVAQSPENGINLNREKDILIESGYLDKNMLSLEYHFQRLQEWKMEKDPSYNPNLQFPDYKNLSANGIKSCLVENFKKASQPNREENQPLRDSNNIPKIEPTQPGGSLFN